jgi:hypothetical protein
MKYCRAVLNEKEVTRMHDYRIPYGPGSRGFFFGGPFLGGLLGGLAAGALFYPRPYYYPPYPYYQPYPYYSPYSGFGGGYPY